MTDVLAPPQMPEDVNPDLALVYDDLKARQDWDTMDVLDAIVIGKRPVTKQAIIEHCCGELNQRNALSVVGFRIKRLNSVMREYGMRIRGNSSGQHPSKITYRICDMCIVLALAGATVVAVPALAEPMVAYRKQPMIAQQVVQCDTRGRITETLRTRFGERRAVHALSGPAGQRQFLEIFTGPTGTWTIIETRPSGWTCLIRSGTDWHIVRQTPSGRPL